MIVVDASAVIDALTLADGTDELRSLLAREELHAPHLLDVEIVAALRGLIAREHLSVARSADVLTDFDDLAVQRWPEGDALRRRALALRHNLTAYDASYVALAEALGTAVVTRDGRLARSTGHAATIRML